MIRKQPKSRKPPGLTKKQILIRTFGAGLFFIAGGFIMSALYGPPAAEHDLVSVKGTVSYIKREYHLKGNSRILNLKLAESGKRTYFGIYFRESGDFIESLHTGDYVTLAYDFELGQPCFYTLSRNGIMGITYEQTYHWKLAQALELIYLSPVFICLGILILFYGFYLFRKKPVT